MPIKKRGGGERSVSPEFLPKIKPIPKRKNKTETPTKTSETEKKPTPSPAAPKPKPKLTNIKRRQPMSSKYVYTEAGVLVVKTPSSTTKWDSDFRMKVVRDYIPPRSLKLLSEYEQKYGNTRKEYATYNIMGKKVQVHYPHELISGTSQTVVLRTDVVNLTDGKKLFLHHSEAAMRILMVYSFLSGGTFGGVPKLMIDDYIPE